MRDGFMEDASRGNGRSRDRHPRPRAQGFNVLPLPVLNRLNCGETFNEKMDWVTYVVCMLWEKQSHSGRKVSRTDTS